MSLIQTVAKTLTKNSPLILTAFGVAGVFVTSVLASKATIVAHERMVQEERATKEVVPPMELIRITWKFYIPAAAMGIVTSSCIIGAHSVHTRREAALMSVYALTEAALKEYKEKVVETIGENKERKIRETISQDRLDQNPVSSNQVIITGRGDVLCYESMTGRYFTSDHETIRKAQNDINAQIINDMYASHNEFCEKVGLPSTTLGDQLGWTTDDLLEIEFNSMISEDGRPCLVLDYRVVPKSNYFRINS